MTHKVRNGGAFLHIPKTGGSWVTKVLHANNLSGPNLGPEHTWVHSEKWAFCVLRDPVDWWLSVWRHRMSEDFRYMGGEHVLHPITDIHDTNGAIFISRVLELCPGFCTTIFREYVARSHYILQTEHLSDHLQLLGSRVGWNTLDVSTPPDNVGRPLADLMTPQLKALLPVLAESESHAYFLWSKAAHDWNTFDI